MTVAALARMVKLSHSLFALPFAVAAVVLVAREARLEPVRLGLVALCVVAARTAAMAMNRIADRRFDEKNPRTAKRELVTGEVSPAAAWGLLLGAAAAFVGGAAAISPLTGWLALPVLAILLGYSFAKRFTWACHLWLGVAQLLAPVGVAIALTGRAPARLHRPRRRGGGLDRRLRPLLGAPGHRLRPERRAPLHPGPLRRGRGAPLGPRASTSWPSPG